MDANRDYGDEDPHADDANEHIERNTISWAICYSRDIAPYLYNDARSRHIYTCTSDQYDHANFYEHGDRGDPDRIIHILGDAITFREYARRYLGRNHCDRVTGDPDAGSDDARHRPSTGGA